MNKIIVLFLFLIAVSCTSKKNATDWFSSKEKIDQELLLLAPYLLSVPEGVSDVSWYNDSSLKERQQANLKQNVAELMFFTVDAKDSMRFYIVSMKDLSSLYEHYKLYGGMYRLKNNKIDSLTEIFISPRLKKEELKEKGERLFDQMVSTRTTGDYYGNKEYVEWPYKGLIYDVPLKKWIMTPENEMYFLQEAKDSVALETQKIAAEKKATKLLENK